MTSLTVENYLKAMLQITLREQGEWVATGQLATALGVSPGTVTSMIKSLAESGLAEYRPYEGVSLTEHGRGVPQQLLRHEAKQVLAFLRAQAADHRTKRSRIGLLQNLLERPGVGCRDCHQLLCDSTHFIPLSSDT